MIRRNDEQIAAARRAKQFGQPRVNVAQRLRIARDMIPMPVQHVKIAEIRQNYAAFLRAHIADRRVKPGHVVRGMAAAGQTLIGKNIINLADKRDRIAVRFRGIKHGRQMRRPRKILAAAGAAEIAGLADKRAGNHPADAVLALQHLAGLLAHFVKLVNRNDLFMRGNLEHAVGGSIDNRFAGGEMFRAKRIKNLRPGSRNIPKNLPPGSAGKFRDDLFGKTARIGWKRLFQDQSHHFPMAGRGIFSGGAFRHFPV